MKKILSASALILALITIFSFVSCDMGESVPEGIWDDATYTSDTTLGEGEKTVTVEVVAADYSVTLTVKTDEENLGDALYKLGIINDPSFFDTCNGMLASWEKDQAYWCFKQDGKKLNYGVGDAKISGGESFSIEYTK